MSIFLSNFWSKTMISAFAKLTLIQKLSIHGVIKGLIKGSQSAKVVTVVQYCVIIKSARKLVK